MDRITTEPNPFWIADIDDVRSRSLPRHEIETVVTVCQESVADNIKDSTGYYHFELADGEQNEDYGGTSDYSCFHEAVLATVAALIEGSTLIHCHVGRSRSAAVAIAAYAIVHDEDYHSAHEMVRTARPLIDPNDLLVEYAKRTITQYNE